MLRMTVLGLLQTLFFAFILKNYLDLSWPFVLTIMLTILVLLFSRVWYLVSGRKKSL